ncbi:MAG: hypothetical protein U0031_09545 [Thermomicrobiales bacterium]
MREESRIDGIARALAHGLSRRQALAVVLGLGAAQVIALTPALAVKDRKRKGKPDDSEDTGEAPAGQAGGVWDAKIDICHFDFESGDYQIMTVSAPALPDYLNQGDTLFIDCCVTADCPARQCGALTNCIEGACMYDPTAGEPCTLDDGTPGVCGKNNVCQSNAPVEAAPVA